MECLFTRFGVKCGKMQKQNPQCKYGDKCYRQNPQHFREYSHASHGEFEVEFNLGRGSVNIAILFNLRMNMLPSSSWHLIGQSSLFKTTLQPKWPNNQCGKMPHWYWYCPHVHGIIQVVLCDTSILIVDTYTTIPVSPRSRYTAV